ncbi:MAG: PPC domain-containing protein [Bacteroidota bacterium]
MTHVLNVLSGTPRYGAVISAAPADDTGDESGSTPFALNYSNGTTVTITSPAVVDGNTFSTWSRYRTNTNEYIESSSNAAYSFVMDDSYTIRAVYVNDESPTDAVAITAPHVQTYTLDPFLTDVDWYRVWLSSGDTYSLRDHIATSSTAFVLYGPGDETGSSIGPWRAQDSYAPDIRYTPTSSGWYYLRVHEPYNSDKTQPSSPASYGLTVEEAQPIYQLVAWTHRSQPMQLDMQPADVDGISGQNGNRRRYAAGTTVTVTAPAVDNDNVFEKWLLQDGGSRELDTSTQLTYSFSMDGDRRAIAVYANQETIEDAVALSLPHRSTQTLTYPYTEVGWFGFELEAGTFYRFDSHIIDFGVRYELFGPQEGPQDPGPMQVDFGGTAVTTWAPPQSGTYFLRVAEEENEYDFAAGPNAKTAVDPAGRDSLQSALEEASPVSYGVALSEADMIDLYVQLQGYYLGSGVMRSGQDWMPQAHPFEYLGHTGWERFRQYWTPGIVDWVLIELRPQADPSVVARRQAAFVRSDGRVVDSYAGGPFGVGFVEPGFYHVVVRHRNHLDVMSTGLIELGAGPAAYYFTYGTGAAMGNNALTRLGDGTYGLWAGDADQDCAITSLDVTNLWLPAFTASALGYLAADYDGDSRVTYDDLLQHWSHGNGQVCQF